MTGNTPLSAALRRVDQPISSARGLPNALYTEDARFRNDRQALFSTTWASVAFGSDVPPGWAVPVTLMGYPLLLTRDKNHTLRVFHNVCSHRGMQLVTQADKLGTGLIRCPYHSWSYDFAGSLRGTPMIGGTEHNEHPDFDPSLHGLKPVRHALWMDNIFVNLSAGAEPFDDFIKPLMQRWSKWINEQSIHEFLPAASHGKMELTVESNWKLAIENFLESYHLPWVHPGLNSYSPIAKHYDIECSEHFTGQGSASYTSPVTEHKIADKNACASSWPKDQKRFAEYPAVFPNTLLGLQADHFFTMIVEPLSATRSRERVQLMFLGEVATEERYAEYRQSVLAGWQSVFEEDIFAVQGMQMGRSSPGYEGGVFSPVMDKLTHHFHKWVAKRLLNHSADQ